MDGLCPQGHLYLQKTLDFVLFAHSFNIPINGARTGSLEGHKNIYGFQGYGEKEAINRNGFERVQDTCSLLQVNFSNRKYVVSCRGDKSWKYIILNFQVHTYLAIPHAQLSLICSVTSPFFSNRSIVTKFLRFRQKNNNANICEEQREPKSQMERTGRF